MKKIISLFLALLHYSYCSAQNLVPNPSFEDTISCPDFAGQVWRAEGWYVAQNTPDYFNACCTGQLATVSVPCNALSCRYAATGVAYCGLWLYCLYPPPEYYEKIGIELLSPMIVGIKYYLSMMVSSVSNHTIGINGGINKLGFLFSTSQSLFGNEEINNNYCQFWTDSIISDTTNWVKMTGAFIADSAYSYLTIGNFFDNAHVDTLRYWYGGNNELCAYYYVDNICVTTDSFGCNFSTGVQSAPLRNHNSISPNPASDHIIIQCESDYPGELTVINSLGQLIYRLSITERISEVEVRDFPNGLYLFGIEQEKKSFSQLISIVH
jgi:hypothetical protein